MNLNQDFRGGAESARIAGISERQRGYWRRTGLVTPSGRLCRYSIGDRLKLALVGEFVRHGVSVQQARLIIPAVFSVLPGDVARVASLSLLLAKHDRHGFRWLLGEVFQVSDGWTVIKISFGVLLVQMAQAERAHINSDQRTQAVLAALPA